jgi:predicted dehydrogenase
MRSVPETLAVGIVGAGTIGRVHVRAIAGLDGVRVAAIAEPQETVGRELASEAGAEWRSSLEDLLNDSVDIVVLATPSGLHPDQAVAAAKAGKHVVTEKPMAITAEGASAMIDAAEAHGVTLAVIFQNRFSPDTIKLKHAVDAGMLGRLILGNAFVHWHRSDDYYAASGGWRGTWALDGGGALINQSIHTIDLLQWMMGDVASIAAHTATLTHHIEAEDTASASLRFRSGALGTIQGTTSAAADYPVRVELIGDRGRAILDSGVLTHWDAPDQPGDELLTDDDRAILEGWHPNEDFGDSHRRQLGQIFAAIRKGSEAPLPGREARKAVDIILGIYESAREGRRIDLSS